MWNILKQLFSNPEPINPEDWGWVERLPRWNNSPHYEQGEFVLYKSTRWVFDSKVKYSPGVIARFEDPLLDADLDYMKAHMGN